MKQAAFPVQEKRRDALMLCTTEIFMYLEENLKLTPQSMSDKAIAFDEVEEMHHQVRAKSYCLCHSTYLSIRGVRYTASIQLRNLICKFYK